MFTSFVKFILTTTFDHLIHIICKWFHVSVPRQVQVEHAPLRRGVVVDKDGGILRQTIPVNLVLVPLQQVDGTRVCRQSIPMNLVQVLLQQVDDGARVCRQYIPVNLVWVPFQQVDGAWVCR